MFVVYQSLLPGHSLHRTKSALEVQRQASAGCKALTLLRSPFCLHSVHCGVLILGAGAGGWWWRGCSGATARVQSAQIVLFHTSFNFFTTNVAQPGSDDSPK